MQHRPCTDRNCSHGRSPFNTIFRRGCVAEHGKAHKLNKPKCMSGEAKLSHPHAKLPSQVPSIQNQCLSSPRYFPWRGLWRLQGQL